MTAGFASQPWLSVPENLQLDFRPRRDSVLGFFRDCVAAAPSAVACTYFDRNLTYAELDRASDALGVAMQDNGVVQGDRIAIILQNDPNILIAMLAAWKAGAVPVPMNPMYRTELTGLFGDCEPRLILCYAADRDTISAAVAASGCQSGLILCDPRDFQSRNDERVLPPAVAAVDEPGALHMASVLRENAGRDLPRIDPRCDEPGLILYTSGTTGKPKGSVSSHFSMAHNAALVGDWCKIDAQSRILGIAPIFHITGVICHLAVTFATGASVVLNYRFEPNSILDAIRATRPTYTIGSITALIALMNLPGVGKDDFASFASIYSGGAPIAPSVSNELRERMGKLIHPGYGMTETTSPTHFCPLGVEAPVDPDSGALSIGVPVYNTLAKIIDDNGEPVADGIAGELCVRGPQIMMGYWKKPQETADTLVDGWLRTGDIAVRDADGWYYLVDRKKDMIVASGFKVWPREVEDVLYSHPAVREAAVIGIPDSYRGENVKAFVSLKQGASADADELVAFCREKLASYKAPRIVEVLDELPKTVTGKIQRHALRNG